MQATTDKDKPEYTKFSCIISTGHVNMHEGLQRLDLARLVMRNKSGSLIEPKGKPMLNFTSAFGQSTSQIR
jgi:hypothetical protein